MVAGSPAEYRSNLAARYRVLNPVDALRVDRVEQIRFPREGDEVILTGGYDQIPRVAKDRGGADGLAHRTSGQPAPAFVIYILDERPRHQGALGPKAALPLRLSDGLALLRRKVLTRRDGAPTSASDSLSIPI